jgi:hypothetical protein
LADSIVKGVGEILQAIKDVVEGDPDPENLRAVFFAIDKLAASNPDNTAYAPSGTVSNGVTNTLGPGDNKCSLFCANAYAQGAGVGFGGKGVPTNTSFFGNKYPPTANDLGNSSKKIANFEVVNTPGLGDIAGFPAGPRSVQGHSGIYSGGGTVIYAGPKNVKIQTVSYVMTVDSHPSVTYRRYKP